MFCENCGNKIKEDHKFCTKCGHSNSSISTHNIRQGKYPITNDKWWHRLFKVIYIFLYLQIFWIVPVVWSLNSSSYSYYRGYEDTTGLAFWYSVLAIVIFVVVIRLIKLAVLYVVLGRKPEWYSEFRKLF